MGAEGERDRMLILPLETLRQKDCRYMTSGETLGVTEGVSPLVFNG